MKATKSICFLAWVLGCISVVVNAEQTHFQRSQANQGEQYEYRWLDHDDKPRSIVFVLSRKTLNSLPQQQLSYQPGLVMREIEIALLRAAQQIDPRVARFTLEKQHDSVSFSLSGKNEKQLETISETLNRVHEDTMNSFLKARYYQQYLTPLRKKAIKPHHVRYIEESVLPLVPAAQSLYDIVDEQSNARSYLNLLLSWAQSIPYNTLESRDSSYGAGFAPPVAILNQNQGDCDSKAVLAASLIRAFLPNNPMKLVLLNNHALLAISMTPLATDETVVFDGIPYILLDPTGPAPLKLGQISKSTRQGLASMNYTLETIPATVPL